MNNRLQELMVQAGYAAPELAGRANKLAELIIRECAGIAERPHEYIKTQSGKQILKHFGVEE
jgi:hypothetical protein